MRAMNLRAFRDELTKIATVAPPVAPESLPGFRGMWNAGWHGVGPKGSMTRQTWRGQGLATPAERAAMGRFGRGFDTVTSLGGATKYLPVGTKAMMAAGTALQARDALKAEDPSGQGRSRTERMTGVGGGFLGGVMGTGAMLRTGFGKKHPLLANMIGGIAGSVAGERAATSPWHGSHVRARQQAHQQALEQQSPPPMRPVTSRVSQVAQ